MYKSNPVCNFLDLILENPYLWKNIRLELTENQWKWVYFFIIGGMTVNDIAAQENTTIEMVTHWEHQVRNKLKDAHLHKRISRDI
ncbi:hypothetical protein [Virgibacillus oceani]|uniref:Uncharacterized protein n=1 Tax=Virgibacillus oceani TaxID=1479511 RepID=A0A917HAX7_9BACI|nr:hypothetical protein [Virgibacillus oceani]GGG72123.1 hypothetical protein GCM10011398_15580 [Virgibacillus oceani]